MSNEIRAQIEAVAKALCHYPSGPGTANSCCPGIGRCEMDAAITEITRLRAELATARREGMEMPPEFLEWMKREMPSGTHIHNPEWWASRVWKAAIRAAAKEGKP